MRNSPQGNNELPSNLAKRNKLEFDMDENDYENIHPKTHEEEKEVTTVVFSSKEAICFSNCFLLRCILTKLFNPHQILTFVKLFLIPRKLNAALWSAEEG